MKVFTITLPPFMTNCYIAASDENECFIIDPASQGDKIVEFINKEKLTPRSILLTHGHFDHIAGADRLREIYNIPLYVHENDAEMICSSVFNGSEMLLSDGIKIKAADKTFTDGEEFTIGNKTLKAMHTPGHTKGSCIFIGEDIIFSGDTIFKGSYGRYDLYGGDFRALVNSIKKILSLEPELVIYPGHGETTSIKDEITGTVFL